MTKIVKRVSAEFFKNGRKKFHKTPSKFTSNLFSVSQACKNDFKTVIFRNDEVLIYENDSVMIQGTASFQVTQKNGLYEIPISTDTISPARASNIECL